MEPPDAQAHPITWVCGWCLRPQTDLDRIPNRASKSGFRRWCRDCENARARRWRKAKPEKSAAQKARSYATDPYKHNLLVTENSWKRLYGLTKEGYDTLLEQQGGKCAICRRPDRGRRLAVDHDHQTHRVRGLLCRTCNLALGWLGDDPVLLAQALEYLSANKEST